jgi:hypothetical protein
MRQRWSPFAVHLPSDWTFFGLTSKYKVLVQEQIFDLVYYGKGFNYNDVINLPVYLRVFFIRKLQKIFDDQKKEQDKAAKAAKSRSRSTPPKFRR